MLCFSALYGLVSALQHQHPTVTGIALALDQRLIGITRLVNWSITRTSQGRPALLTDLTDLHTMCLAASFQAVT